MAKRDRQGAAGAHKTAAEILAAQRAKEEKAEKERRAKNRETAVRVLQKGSAIAATLLKAFGQHPEWYTHYSTSNLVQLNLSQKQDVAYRALGIHYTDTAAAGHNLYLGMPAVATVEVQLTVPQGDYEGWKTGIRLLWQQMRTANSGRINFTPEDLEKYILNVRALHAINAYTRRAYETTYTFRSTNAQFPAQWLIAMGFDPDSFMANAADLFMFSQRIAERCRVTFPLKIDFFNRAKWMFSNIFADSDSAKPSFYVPSLRRNPNTLLNSRTSLSTVTSADGVFYFTSDVASSDVKPATWEIHKIFSAGNAANHTFTFTYEEYTSQVQELINDLITDPMMTLIAADIIKAFGNEAFDEWESPDIAGQATILYDENALTQWQNANVLYVGNGDPFNIEGTSDRMEENTSYVIEDIEVNGTPTSSTWISSEIISSLGSLYHGTDDLQDGAAQTIGEHIIDRTNTYLLNWKTDSIDSGHVLSITRLVPSNAALTVNTTPTQLLVANYHTFGTEYIPMIWVNMPYADTPYGRIPGIQGSGEMIPIAGTIVVDTFNNSYGYSGVVANQVAAAWANFDWSPRYRLTNRIDNNSESGFPAAIGPDVLDWDVFAETEWSTLRLFYSYGNQSLTYAGKSQNQSNRSVYGRQNKKKLDDKEKGGSQTTPPQQTPDDKK